MNPGMGMGGFGGQQQLPGSAYPGFGQTNQASSAGGYPGLGGKSGAGGYPGLDGQPKAAGV